MNEHLTPHQLQALVDGKLPADEADRAMAHLGECDQCLADADRRWAVSDRAPVLQRAGSPAPQASMRMEQALFSRIHRLRFLGEVLRLATGGFASLLTTLLRPPARRRSRRENQDERE